LLPKSTEDEAGNAAVADEQPEVESIAKRA